MSGGICRLKYHLAKIPGHDVGACRETTPEIMRIAFDALETKDKNKDEKATKNNEISLRSSGTYAAEGQGSGRGSTDSGTASRRPSSYFPERTTPGAQPGIRSMFKKKEKKEADRAVGRCLFYSDIPLSITKNNPFWQPMCDAIAVVGPGYKSPTFEELRGPILQEEKADINSRLAEFKKSWEISGCTVMSDGWTDRKGRSLLNFLVHCSRGTMFIKSIDASAHVKDATLLCELMDAFIHEIGVHNVVQIITDNAANYVAAGRLLMERNRSLFWTPCAAHCIDLMLEDMGKTSFIKEVIDQARSVPKFIYNHIWVLSLMRRHTRNRELRRPAITRFATNFITLQSLLQCQFELKQMFVCDEWRDSTYSRKEDGKAIARLVYSDSFWEGVAEVCSVTEPLVKVLRLVDSDKPVMGYLYEAMDKAKEAIRAYYVGKGSHGFHRQMLLWDLIDTRWTGMLHRPIHAATIFLNPAFSYKCNFDFDGEVMEGLHACLQRMVPDVAICLDINREIEMYRDGTGLFGYEDAIASRNILLPHVWWRNYGARAPNLQRFAIRILSQTCTSSGCERNWSVFEKIHSKKRTRLEFSRLNDLVYVHYNLRLWLKQIDRTPNVDAISLDNIDVLSKWRVESEMPTMEEAPAWIDEEPEQQQALEEQQGEEEREEEQEDEEEWPEDIMEGDMQSSAQPSTLIDASTPTDTNGHPLSDAGPSTVRGRPDKQPLIFSRKRARGGGRR